MVRKLHIIFQIWIMEEISKRWSKSIICSVHKKGDLMECHNCRELYLLHRAYKMLSNIMCKSCQKLSMWTLEGQMCCRLFITAGNE
jgi:hypothetical protein